MFTVLILNKRSADLMRDYRFLFKPFVDEGLIGICDWNESGTDVKTSVPDLYNIIKGKKEWRAVVLNTDSVYGYQNCERPDKYNPFDYEDTETLPHESKIPLIRLTHIIGGYNASPTKEFEKGFEYFDPELGVKKKVRESELTEEEYFALNQKYDKLIPIYVEKKVSDDVKDMQSALSKKYAFADARPTEINLIATRGKTENNEKAIITESWKNHLEISSSSFWERNKYPNNARFMFFEITNAENTMYCKELTEFWLTVLTIVTNRIPASTLQAYRLYRVGVDISKENMTYLLNEHINKLYAAYSFINDSLKRKPELSFDENEEPVTRQIVPVILDKNERAELYIDNSKVGLSRDCPVDEVSAWSARVAESKENLEKYLKMPKRSVDKSAAFLRAKTDSFTGDYYELDKFQLEDIKEIMDELEWRIVLSDKNDAMNKKRIYAALEESDKEVRREISTRMRRNTALISGALMLLLCFCGYLPYLIFSGLCGMQFLGKALLLTGGVILVSSAGGLIALFVQRHKLKKKMKAYNSGMLALTMHVRSGISRFETYFGDICTYMKAKSIIDGTELKNDNAASTQVLLNAHKAALRSAISRASEWFGAFELEHTHEIYDHVSQFFNAGELPKENGVYFFVPNHEEEDLPVNNTGDRITSPYKFLERLNVIREDIFDEVEEEE